MKVVVLGCVLLVACGDTGTVTPDAPPASDGKTPGAGLSVTWSAQPNLPGAIDNNIAVSSASFKINHLQVISDAGPTTQSDYALVWGGESQPAQLAFANAPPGRYSKVTLDIDAGLFDDSYDIYGTVFVQNQTKEFHIHDRNEIVVSINCDATLAPAGSATIALELALMDALTNIDYADLDDHDGGLELDSSDDQMPAFRAKLIQSFKGSGIAN